jgi:hypothetical protein
MPTLLRVGRFRFFCYSSDRAEPEHVHVEADDGAAKFWLRPVRLAGSRGLSRFSCAVRVRLVNETIVVELRDGRTVTAPLTWYPRLRHGSARERRNWRLIGGGMGIHWPDLDEDLSVESLLAGRRSGESHTSLAKWLASRKTADKRRQPARAIARPDRARRPARG